MRIQRTRSLLTATCIVAIAVSGIAFAALDPQKFVAGWRLNLTSEGAFYDVLLTHEVYQFSRSLNERQRGIFNSWRLADLRSTRGRSRSRSSRNDTGG